MATSNKMAVHQKLQTNDRILTTAVISSSSFSLDKAMKTNDTRRPNMQISLTGSVLVVPNHLPVLMRSISMVNRAGTLMKNQSHSHGPSKSHMHAARKGTSMIRPISLKLWGSR